MLSVPRLRWAFLNGIRLSDAMRSYTVPEQCKLRRIQGCLLQRAVCVLYRTICEGSICSTWGTEEVVPFVTRLWIGTSQGRGGTNNRTVIQRWKCSSVAYSRRMFGIVSIACSHSFECWTWIFGEHLKLFGCVSAWLEFDQHRKSFHPGKCALKRCSILTYRQSLLSPDVYPCTTLRRTVSMSCTEIPIRRSFKIFLNDYIRHGWCVFQSLTDFRFWNNYSPRVWARRKRYTSAIYSSHVCP